MKINVRFFASLREASGQGQVVRELPEGTKLATLLAQLNREYPRLPVAAGAIYLAVNQVYASGEQVLHDGDEVALFPPVSGGGASA